MLFFANTVVRLTHWNLCHQNRASLITLQINRAKDIVEND
jgi:hypothetical protein